MLSHLRTHDARLFAQLDVITAGLVEATTLLHRLLSGSAADAAATAGAVRALDVSSHAGTGVDVRTFTAYAKRLESVAFRDLAASLDAAFESVQDWDGARACAPRRGRRARPPRPRRAARGRRRAAASAGAGGGPA